MKYQNGFTLMELVIVIVVLGILAAVAIPNYIDFKSEAGTAHAKGLAGGLTSASAINLAACKTGLSECYPISASSPPTCNLIALNLLVGGFDSSQVTLSVTPTFSGNVGTCTVTPLQGTVATASIHATEP